jgi:hypothetical protein
VWSVQNHWRDLRHGYDHLLHYLRAAQVVIASKSASFRRCYGPEFIAKKVCDWITAVGAKTAYIEPGTDFLGNKLRTVTKAILIYFQKHILRYQILMATFFSRFLPFRLLMLFIFLKSQSRSDAVLSSSGTAILSPYFLARFCAITSDA